MQAKTQWIASNMQDRIARHLVTTPVEIMKDLKRNYDVDVSYYHGRGKYLHTNEYWLVEKTPTASCHLKWSNLRSLTPWLGHAWSVNRTCQFLGFFERSGLVYVATSVI